MAAPVPFRTKKGDTWSPWKAIVPGKGMVELGNGTKEDADNQLAAMLPSTPTVQQERKSSLSVFPLNLGKTAPQESSVSTDSMPSSTAKTSLDKSSEKPKPGELRKNGLSELSPERLKKFREQVAIAISTGNVSLDRALVSIFRDKVPILAPEQYMLLSTGWELACEQYFVNGVPPAWIIILLGNALVCTSLYEKSEEKKPEEAPKADGATRIAAGNGIRPN